MPEMSFSSCRRRQGLRDAPGPFRRRRPAPAGGAGIVLLLLAGCATDTIRPPPAAKPHEVVMTVTGYCNCGECCGWRRTWYGRPVYASGPGKGRRKQIGVTASGRRARHGTVAADTSRYPFGTIVHVPGYGYGRVSDVGGAIKGDKLDVWFPSHAEAVRWGKQTLKVRVWLPR
jgi:3D (Asp-Asp-Asp) domain-containing protein